MLQTKKRSKNVKLKKTFYGNHFLTWEDVKEYSGCKFNKKNLWFLRDKEHASEIANSIVNAISCRQHSFRKTKIGSCYDLFRTCRPKTLKAWSKLYFHKHGDLFEKSIDDLYFHLTEGVKVLYGFKSIRKQRKEEMKENLRNFAKSLVIDRTYYGFAIQEALFVFLSKEYQLEYEESSDKEDSRQVDGYLDEIPFSVKPSTFRYSSEYGKKRNVRQITYEANEEGIAIYLPSCVLWS